MPDMAVAGNGLSVDLSKDFYPFGEQPRFNDTLYLAAGEALSEGGARVTVDINLSNPSGATSSPIPVVYTQGNPGLAWEVWDGQRWYDLSAANFTDDTAGLTRNGQVAFTLPETVGEGTVNGETGHWLRMRLVQGHYGQAPTYRTTSDGNGYELVPATFAPPSIRTARFGYVAEPTATLSTCMSANDFTYVDHTAAAANGPSFQPFTRPADTRPTLYLGFDQPFANRPVTLYAQVDAPSADEVASRDATPSDPARVRWEYAGPEGWRNLGAEDDTQAFADRGLITFIGPYDWTERREFSQSRYWLRVQWVGGTFPIPPRLRRLLTNTTWALQATTVRDEILGSSNAAPEQLFRTPQAPVLVGQQLEVQEPEPPSVEDRRLIEREEGADAVRTVEDARGGPSSIWVRWHQVPDFGGSGPRHRHYVLNHTTGEVRFGNGRNGMVPPRGRDNVRLSVYRTGGGAQGNRPADTINQLKTTIPYVDRVTNYEAARGGAEAETYGDVKARAPLTLRHRGRAVTAQDIADLAYEASSEVARVRVITPHFNPFAEPPDGDRVTPPADDWIPPFDERDAGRVGLILVPGSRDPQPTPSLALIDRVEQYILDRCAPTLDLWLAGPDWVRVAVTADIVPVSPDAAGALETAVTAALERFLHPLTGGVDGAGWVFGRQPQASDIYALISSVAGVDHVRSLTLTTTPEIDTLPVNRLERFLIFSGTHTITLVTSEDGV